MLLHYALRGGSSRALVPDREDSSEQVDSHSLIPTGDSSANGVASTHHESGHFPRRVRPRGVDRGRGSERVPPCSRMKCDGGAVAILTTTLFSLTRCRGSRCASCSLSSMASSLEWRWGKQNGGALIESKWVSQVERRLHRPVNPAAAAPRPPGRRACPRRTAPRHSSQANPLKMT